MVPLLLIIIIMILVGFWPVVTVIAGIVSVLFVCGAILLLKKQNDERKQRMTPEQKIEQEEKMAQYARWIQKEKELEAKPWDFFSVKNCIKFYACLLSGSVIMLFVLSLLEK